MPSIYLGEESPPVYWELFGSSLRYRFAIVYRESRKRYFAKKSTVGQRLLNTDAERIIRRALLRAEKRLFGSPGYCCNLSVYEIVEMYVDDSFRYNSSLVLKDDKDLYLALNTIPNLAKRMKRYVKKYGNYLRDKETYESGGGHFSSWWPKTDRGVNRNDVRVHKFDGKNPALKRVFARIDAFKQFEHDLSLDVRDAMATLKTKSAKKAEKVERKYHSWFLAKQKARQRLVDEQFRNFTDGLDRKHKKIEQKCSAEFEGLESEVFEETKNAEHSILELETTLDSEEKTLVSEIEQLAKELIQTRQWRDEDDLAILELVDRILKL